MNKKFFIITVAAIILSATQLYSSGRAEIEPAQAAETEVKVFVSVLPQQWFVERIGGERVSVDVMVQPGRSPSTYDPSPNQVAALAGADLFFTIGVPFENAFLPKIKGALKGLKIIDVSAGVEKRMLSDHNHDEAEEGDDDEDHEEHTEGALDPHIWLSPVLAVTQAQNIYNALVEFDPEGMTVYAKGLAEVTAELELLDAKISAELAPFAGNTLFIFHPTLGYFADRYNLKQVAIEAGGKEPSAAELGEIISHAKEEGVKIIFVQPEFSEESAAVIAEAIDGNVVKLNPLNPDYINSLTEIADKIRRSYE